MLAVIKHMSYGWQTFVYAVALIVFIVAAVLSYLSKAFPMFFISVGLACMALVLLWNAAALT